MLTRRQAIKGAAAIAVLPVVAAAVRSPYERAPEYFGAIYTDEWIKDHALISWYDYGSDLSLSDTETLTLDFGENTFKPMLDL